jgi:ribonuclease Z
MKITGISRRGFLKASGVALGGLPLVGAVAGTGTGQTPPAQQCDDSHFYPVDAASTQRYSYLDTLRKFTPDMQPDLGDDEMRITFLGTGSPPPRRAQRTMSIFVEVGPWMEDPGGGFGKAKDSFVFDCGAGCVANYGAMGINYSRMDKVYLSHLHGDHMSDLTLVYCFGPTGDRKWPLYVWGPGPSGMKNPSGRPKYYDDGVYAFCSHFREAMRWHTEAFSFQQNGYLEYDVPTQKDWNTPVRLEPVGGDDANDGYAIVPIQLDWTKTGIAYENNGVRITHFPVIHNRRGSMGYKLEWNGLSMMYTSDTRPSRVSIQQARNGGKGVDVFIHEMTSPPELWAMKNLGLAFPDHSVPGFDQAVDAVWPMYEACHTGQGAFGHLLSQIEPRPQLAVPVHFPVADDTVACAMNSVRKHFPHDSYPVLGKDIVWPTDLMVLKVKRGKPPEIEQFMGDVSDYAFVPPPNVYSPLTPAKYPSPTAQLDETDLIEPGADTYCENGY